MTIEYRVKNVYGNEMIYPITHSESLMSLTGKKTIDKKDIKALETMGFSFKQVI